MYSSRTSSSSRTYVSSRTFILSLVTSGHAQYELPLQRCSAKEKSNTTEISINLVSFNLILRND